MTDEVSLIKRAQAGDSGAFARLAERYYPRVYYHALKQCGNAWDAGDVTQNTIIKAYLNLGGLFNPAAFGAWLFRICDNEHKLLLRQRDKNLTDGLPPAAGRADISPAQQKLRNAVQVLEERQRLLVELKYFAAFSVKEIALLVGIPQSTVKNRLFAARQKLKALLENPTLNFKSERRKWLMEKLKRMELGAKVIPCMSRYGQSVLMEDALEKRSFSAPVLSELEKIDGGREWAAACEGSISYDEFLEILACCDEPTIFRISEANYGTWGPRMKSKIIDDLSRISGTGGYVESIEPIMLVPSIIETVEWYRRHLGWEGCGTQEDEDYGYSQLHAYTKDFSHPARKNFKGFHLRKGPPTRENTCFCFVVNLEALRARILQSGWDKVDAICDRGWGTKSFTCTDLNGYRLEFCEWL
jgi:RNA polymerase sigma-70 factor (ECF subfamily)